MTQTTETLQYQLSNGSWINCDDRSDGFLAKCVATTGTTQDEVLTLLKAGKTVRNDASDWYSNCRFEPIPVEHKLVETVLCSCGCSVPKSSVMHASMGTACPDCYDEMSY